MPTRPLTDDKIRLTLKKLRETNHNVDQTAQFLDCAPATVRRHIREAEYRGLTETEPGETPKGPSFPTLPDDRPSNEEYRDWRKKSFQRKYAARLAREWFPIEMPDDKPVGICWFGDPHVDDDGCNWPLLEEHAEICARTDGLYGANLGDTTNNWVGRLTRLYMHQDQSRDSALQGAEIFISGLGIEWLLLIRGNHDIWSGDLKNDPLYWMQSGPAPMEDWEARLRLVFPNKQECFIHASHHFRGTSLFHPLHGSIRQVLEAGQAQLYISGHTQEYGTMKIEMPKRGTVHCLGKARGYKHFDMHALLHGFGEHQEGASLVSIHDPNAKTQSGFVNLFDDVETAADYLTFLRERGGRSR